jgi:hypothetical protein
MTHPILLLGVELREGLFQWWIVKDRVVTEPLAANPFFRNNPFAAPFVYESWIPRNCYSDNTSKGSIAIFRTLKFLK